MDNCKHFWVNRKDGWEEGCGAAICLLCGKHDCYCDFNIEIENLPKELKERRKRIFEELGIEGNDHQIEKELGIK